MIWRIGVLLASIGLIIYGIGAYLAPNDIAGCEKPQSSGDCREADAVVVISGGDTIARTNEAIRLYQSGWAPLVIFSGAAADKDGPSNANVMRQHAINWGVPVDATAIEDRSETTKQNAEQVKSQLEARGIKRVILVTSGYHVRRASLEFSRQLGPEIELVRHPVASDKHWSPLWWMTPWGWWLALGELVKVSLFYVGGSR